MPIVLGVATSPLIDRRSIHHVYGKLHPVDELVEIFSFRKDNKTQQLMALFGGCALANGSKPRKAAIRLRSQKGDVVCCPPICSWWFVKLEVLQLLPVA
jgi:hypothetical protein